MVKGGGHLVPLVQDLGQAHMRRAGDGCLAALAGLLQRLSVGRQCRIQVALGALHLAQVVADAHGEKASEELAGCPQLGEPLCQAALGWPGPSAQPVRRRLVPAHQVAHQPVVLAQLGQGLPVVVGREGGITTQPREHGAQERDPRGDIGQRAHRPSGGCLIRFVVADRKGALGVIEQGLKCFHLEAHGGAVRLGQAQARTVAYRLRRQRRKPAAQGRALAAAEQRLDVPLDQPRCPGRVPGGQGVAHRVVGEAMIFTPGGRGPVQRRDPAGPSLQPGAEQVGEQVVVAPPAAHLIQRYQEQAGPLYPLQHRLAVGAAGDRITQPAGQAFQQRGFQQEGAQLLVLAVQHLLGQVVQDIAVAAAERRHEPGGIRLPRQ